MLLGGVTRYGVKGSGFLNKHIAKWFFSLNVFFFYFLHNIFVEMNYGNSFRKTFNGKT